MIFTVRSDWPLICWYNTFITAKKYQFHRKGLYDTHYRSTGHIDIPASRSRCFQLTSESPVWRLRCYKEFHGSRNKSNTKLLIKDVGSGWMPLKFIKQAWIELYSREVFKQHRARSNLSCIIRQSHIVYPNLFIKKRICTKHY